jgi:hypothetical protein
MARTVETATEIRPFRVEVPQADLDDLRPRIAATRWPDQETVADRSQGAKLAELQELVRYWGTDYDWRKAEAQLNAWPQFITTVDGVDIHFIHVRSRHENALPLIISHGGVDAGARRVHPLDVRQGSQPVADQRRGAGQLLAALADEHRDLGGEALLGEPRPEPHQCGRAEGR